MRRLILSVGLTLVVMAAVAVVAYAAAPVVNGAGKSEERGQIQVETHGPDQGHFNIRQADAEGPVDCVSASGNRAIIGGHDADDGRTFLIFIEDNGNPGKDNDRHNWRMATPLEAGSCPPDPVLGATAPELDAGNYHVRP